MWSKLFKHIYGIPDQTCCRLIAFAQLLEDRLPYYRLADYRISTEGVEPEQAVENILKLKVFG